MSYVKCDNIAMVLLNNRTIKTFSLLRVYFRLQKQKTNAFLFKTKNLVTGILFTILYIPFIFPFTISAKIDLSQKTTDISDLLCCNHLK